MHPRGNCPLGHNFIQKTLNFLDQWLHAIAFIKQLLDKAEHDVLRLQQITLTEVWTIVDIMQKPNLILVLLFIYKCRSF